MEKNTFAQNLKKIRKEKNLKQNEVAKIIGVSNSTYCQYENGQREPDVLKIIKIANILEVSGDVLLGIENNNASLDNVQNSNDLKYDIMQNYNKLNDVYKKFIENQINELLEIQEKGTLK